MKKGDYYRYAQELALVGWVELKDRTELIEFFSKLIAEEYGMQLSNRRLAMSYGQDWDDLAEREKSETTLIERYVKDYLEGVVASNCLAKVAPKLYRHKFDVKKNRQMYKSVLKRLNQRDTPEDAFRDDVRYIIEGSRIVRWEAI